MTPNLDLHREQIINRVYDLILKPDELNDFMSIWDAYITELSAQHDDAENPTGQSEITVSDDGLEVHFARVYAILEGLGRNRDTPEDPDADANKGILYRFDLNGRVLAAPTGTIGSNTPILCAADVAHLLSEDAAVEWAAFLKAAQRAPAISNFRLFALETGGNLIAYTTREDTSDVQIIIRELITTWTPRLRQLLVDHFQLTKSEMLLIESLTAHGTLEAIAKQSNRSKNTLRAQMKSTFKKMNLTSQPAVLQTVAMLAHYCETIAPEGPAQTAGPNLGTLIEVPAGDVTVPVHLFGPEDGHPILFIHGMLDGVALNDPVIDALHTHKLRFISPVRPNFGAAPPHPDIARAPEVFAHQLKDIAAHFALKDALVLGHMSGGLFAIAASPHISEHIAGIVNISCGIPILSTKQFAKLSKRQKAMAYTTRYAPAILPGLLRAGVSQIDSIEIETLMDDMYPSVSPDRTLLETNPDIAAVVLDGYRFAVAQGYKAFQADAIQVTRNWSDLVQANNLPVMLIHGHHDPAADYDYMPDFAAKAGYDLCDYPDDGQLLLYGKPDQVLADISNFLKRLMASEHPS